MDNLYNAYFDAEAYNLPYENYMEHTNDLLYILDMYICIYMMTEHKENEDYEFNIEGMNITFKEVMESLESWDLEKRNLIVNDDLSKQIIKAWEHIQNRSRLSDEAGIFLRFNHICSRLSLSDIEIFCFISAIACDFNRKYENIFSYLQNDIRMKLPAKSLIISMWELIHKTDSKEKSNILNENSILFDYLFIKTENEAAMTQMSKIFRIKKRVIDYLMGNDDISSQLKDYAVYFGKNYQYQHSKVLKDKIIKVCQLIDSINITGENAVINIFGEEGIGKKLIVKNAAHIFKFNVLFMDLKDILYLPKTEAYEIISALFLEVLLNTAVICFINADEYRQNFESNLNYILKLADNNFNMFFVLSKEKIRAYENIKSSKISIEIENLSITNKIILWEELIQEYEISKDVDINLNANKYNLNALGIKNILNTAKLHSYYEGRSRITQDDIIFSVKQQNSKQLGEYASLINAVFTWDDLIIDEEQKYQMQMFCNQLKYRNIVGEKWGFNKKMPYGRGLCAMFYGSPGTGKTMAVQVIANELGMDLYRIDLSQMVSKYIGETEKNISELFKKAKNINALLFFDEADALFAKRSEVKDSNDRNANAETAHLLQKLEEYDGISILATNYINNIDDAFKRRIKFIINFSFPSAQERYKLWTSILPKEAKIDKNVDFEFFANEFELSGSNIKEILVNSAYIAVSQNKPISNIHIIQAIKNNFIKQGKVLLKSDFKEYSDLL